MEGVPDELPASSTGSDVTVIHLERMGYEDLMKLSRESAPDPLGALLPTQPGILPEREARLTGVPSPGVLHKFADAFGCLMNCSRCVFCGTHGRAA